MRNYLSRILGEQVKLSNEIASNKSKRLLRYSDKPISSIAAYPGFSSQGHFSNVFRKYSDCFPNEYRLKHNKYPRI